MLAAETLQLRGQPAPVVVGPDERVDALSDPGRPAGRTERVRIGRVRALVVRVLEFADVAEDPFSGQLGHGLGLATVDEEGVVPELVEPGEVGDVGRGQGNPLRVQDDGARPEGLAVFAVNFGMFFAHFLVQVWLVPEVGEFEGGAQDAYTEVVVAGEVFVVGHLYEDV